MKSLHQPIQRRNLQRLHKLAIETFPPAASLVSGPCEPAQRIDPRLFKAIEGTQVTADGVAIQPRHFDIEENDIRVTLASDAKCVLAVGTNMHILTSQLQQLAQ